LRQRKGFLALRAGRRFFRALCFVALLAACAPLTYNRYQPAQTMGEGQFKLAASAEFGREMIATADSNLTTKMDADMTNWGVDHSQYASQIDAAKGADIYAKTLRYTLGPAIGYPVPTVDVYAAYGASKDLDFEVSLSTDLYARLNAKVQAWRFGGNGALAVSPGFGFLRFGTSDSGRAGGVSMKDKYSGYVGTFEAPVTVGWQFDHVSPYFGLLPSYQYVQATFTRIIHQFKPSFNQTVDAEYDIFSVGLVAGVQCKFRAFILTPEIVLLYSFASSGLTFPQPVFFSPGLQLGAQW
jgi:hypothetical protein